MHRFSNALAVWPDLLMNMSVVIFTLLDCGSPYLQVKAFIKAVSRSGIRMNEPRVRKELPPSGELPR